MGQKAPATDGQESPKAPRTNLRTWRKGAERIVAVRTTANGATRADLLATAAGPKAAAVTEALRATEPPTTWLYRILPDQDGAATVREALAEAARRWRAADLTGATTGRKMPRKRARKKPDSAYYLRARDAKGAERSDAESESEAGATTQPSERKSQLG